MIACGIMYEYTTRIDKIESRDCNNITNYLTLAQAHMFKLYFVNRALS